jgi:hypothetical protein
MKNKSILNGLDYLLAAQYEMADGQFYPLKKDIIRTLRCMMIRW